MLSQKRQCHEDNSEKHSEQNMTGKSRLLNVISGVRYVLIRRAVWSHSVHQSLLAR